MSWLRRRHGSANPLAAVLLVAALALPLAGCGFHPMYGSVSRDVDPDLATVKITPIAERLGQVITTELQDGFNPSGMRVQPKYSLDVAVSKSRGDQLVRTDGTASRTEVSVYANFTLRRLADNATLIAGTVRSISGFDIMTSEYTNLVAGNTIELRAGSDLAEQIRTRIALYLQSGAEQASDEERLAAARAAKLRGGAAPTPQPAPATLPRATTLPTTQP
ncbi:MAG TPA: LPS assembly lipoprotein LptE [Stellaceae bacterium]|nr:LPS assembly lipoprotein LptE [Stellaceae bacterium]